MEAPSIDPVHLTRPGVLHSLSHSLALVFPHRAGTCARFRLMRTRWRRSRVAKRFRFAFFLRYIGCHPHKVLACSDRRDLTSRRRESRGDEGSRLPTNSCPKVVGSLAPQPVGADGRSARHRRGVDSIRLIPPCLSRKVYAISSALCWWNIYPAGPHHPNEMVQTVMNQCDGPGVAHG